MGDLYAIGTDGEQRLAAYLTAAGRVVRPSDTKTFDLIVDGTYAEVKSSLGPYSAYGLVGLTENQFCALKDGVEFSVYVVCNLRHPDNLEIIEIPSTAFGDEAPKAETTYYWYRAQLQRMRELGPVGRKRDVSAPAVFCADIGSVRKGNFGWYGTHAGLEWYGSEPASLTQRVGERLRAGTTVALGFECPLFVPLADRPEDLTSARVGDGSKPWSAGAGAGALATGLTQVTWILRALRAEAPRARAHLNWSTFTKCDGDLLLWEAFVSGSAKGKSHCEDAKRAVTAFCNALPDPTTSNAIAVAEAFSLIAAAMLRTGWAFDPALLAEPAIVIRAPAPTNQAREQGNSSSI